MKATRLNDMIKLIDEQIKHTSAKDTKALKSRGYILIGFDLKQLEKIKRFVSSFN